MTNSTATTFKLTETREINTGFDMHCLSWEYVEDSARGLHDLASTICAILEEGSRVPNLET